MGTTTTLDMLDRESTETLQDALRVQPSPAEIGELEKTIRRQAELAAKAGPPRRETHCPACDGRGSVIAFDREAMIAKRKSLRISQSAVARAAGWQASVVSELESGSRPMTPASAERYWKALHEAEKGA